ncbi:MAG: hypothetical protein RSB29_00010 [Alistipes sp.]
MRRGGENIVVLLLSFAIFAAGVYALFNVENRWYMWGCLGALVLIALRQSLIKLKKK